MQMHFFVCGYYVSDYVVSKNNRIKAELTFVLGTARVGARP